MNRMILAAIVAFSGAVPALASDQDDVKAVIQRFMNSFEKGDRAEADATCAPETAIIDEFAPYEWHGAKACSRWMDDFEADAKKNTITDAHVTAGEPRHVDVTADRAYVVMPTEYNFKQGGKPVSEKDARMTLSLQKGAGGWRITAWTWTKP